MSTNRDLSQLFMSIYKCIWILMFFVSTPVRVNCKILENNKSIGRIIIYLFIFYFFILFLTQIYTLHNIIHHQHRLCYYKEEEEDAGSKKKKKKTEITDCNCELVIFVLLTSDHQFLFGFVFSLFFFFEKCEK